MLSKKIAYFSNKHKAEKVTKSFKKFEITIFNNSNGTKRIKISKNKSKTRETKKLKSNF